MAAATRVALVGFGYWGSNLARNLDAAVSTSLVAVADPEPDRRAAAAKSYPAAAVLETYDEVLASPEVDAVVLATPAATHAEMSIRALESGRHVLVEKPLALTVPDAREVVAAAEKHDRVAMVGHTFLYSAPVLRLRELIRSGELGTVQYLYSQRLSLGKIRQDCDALWNFAPHDVAIMRFLLGEAPESVSATGFSFINAGIDDVAFASLRFGSGIGANIHVSWIDPRKIRLLTVVGDRKMAVYDDVSVDRKLWIHDAGVAISASPTLGEYSDLGEFQSKTRVGDIHVPHIAMTEPLLNEVEAFGAACAGGPPPPTDATHGLEVVAVLDAMTRSVAAGGTRTEVSW